MFLTSSNCEILDNRYLQKEKYLEESQLITKIKIFMKNIEQHGNFNTDNTADLLTARQLREH